MGTMERAPEKAEVNDGSPATAELPKIKIPEPLATELRETFEQQDQLKRRIDAHNMVGLGLEKSYVKAVAVYEHTIDRMKRAMHFKGNDVFEVDFAAGTVRLLSVSVAPDVDAPAEAPGAPR